MLIGRSTSVQTVSAREVALAALREATAAVDPAQAVRRAVQREGDVVLVAGQPYDLRAYQRVFVIGSGKATATMALAIEELLGDRITGGVVTVKAGFTTPTTKIEQVEAGHPLPNEAGVAGTRQVLALAREAGAADLVICLISGGGSALFVAPAAPITLEEQQALTALMLRAGCTINDMNTVRKHCSDVKGGQLARAVAPAALLTLIVSDVVGNPLDVIASGPTVADTSSFADAIAVLQHYDILGAVPASVRARLEAGARGALPETPKAGDPVFARVTNVVIGSNDLACAAAEAEARRQGYHTLVLSTFVEGEAREVARVLAAIGKQIAHDGRPIPIPACVIAGGETTVTVRGDGLGGRNQELALAAATRIAGHHRIVVTAYATDGDDGPTDAAGAVVDGGTVARAHASGIDCAEALRRNDAYHALAAAGDLLRTGPTGTNVNDLMLVLVE
jgi:hydroxypyruvate reductase